MTTPHRLTPAMKHALRLGSRKGGVHVGTGRQENGEEAPSKRVTKQVARKLVEAGFAVHHATTLLTVEAGHAELAKPTPHTPVYLRQGDGLTTRIELRVRDEGELMQSTPARDRAAEERRLEAQDRRERARAARDRVRRAA
ncbi:MAG: hypothetical protein AVDCRST_MAG68-2080 [uncultured Gemmatimonadetes bacterium]|uniref:Uncharacterized protein n=1 Tax=uncultured Gemmatimonadota bacterium TaxID=203437 RepID=A0A6J4L5C6_9BACT|nr:MAG: hypothetical protein AVDCRST_MAG68-2080 [uncultured Gemmatimonadota bacterium]